MLDICSADGITLVCGENGTLLYSRDGQAFEQIKLKGSGTVSGVAAFGGRFFAGAGNGQIFVSEDGKAWEAHQTGTDNDILAIAATDQCLMAITAETDLLTSFDGERFEHINFNLEYEDYYDPRTFGGLCSLGNTLFVFGQMLDNPGEPYVMYTETADVWFFKLLTTVNGEAFTEQMPITVRTVGISGDQLVAVCDRGRLLTITECTECHRISEAGDADWSRIAMGGGTALLVGRDYRFELLDENAVRQTEIGADQAHTDIQNGAAVIDVRTAEERAEGYIPGSLHIPVDEIAEKLPLLVPETDREIIFYCAAGARAQTALEQALALGYETVYNLGGFSDWPFDVEYASEE